MSSLYKLFRNKTCNLAKSRPFFTTGLTLIETLVAISVLMVAVSGALSLSNKSLESASYAKDQVTAFYLAAEGIEGIRSIRDSNLIVGSNWLSGLGACNASGCYFDGTTSVVSSCAGACGPLQFDEASGLYGYNPSWSTTAYTRTIRLDNLRPNERLITVTVTWNSGNIARTFTLRELLLDWYE